MGPRFLVGTALLSVPIFLVTATLFAAFPRVGRGFLTFSAGEGQRVSGFGRNVELGDFGTIRQDATVVMRVRGVGEEYSELLEAAGVDTVKELKKRKPDNLREAMVAANAKRKLVRQLPGVAQVEKWVAHAKELPAVMKY